MPENRKSGWGCFPLSAALTILLMVVLASVIAVRVTPWLRGVRGVDTPRKTTEESLGDWTSDERERDGTWDGEGQNERDVPGNGPVSSFRDTHVEPLVRALGDDEEAGEDAAVAAVSDAEGQIPSERVLSSSREALIKQLHSLSRSWRTISNRLNNEYGRYEKRYRLLPVSRLDPAERVSRVEAENQRRREQNKVNEEKQRELRRLREVAKERLSQMPRRAEISYLTEAEIRSAIAQLGIPDGYLKYAVPAHERKWHER